MTSNSDGDIIDYDYPEAVAVPVVTLSLVEVPELEVVVLPTSSPRQPSNIHIEANIRDDHELSAPPLQFARGNHDSADNRRDNCANAQARSEEELRRRKTFHACYLFFGILAAGAIFFVFQVIERRNKAPSFTRPSTPQPTHDSRWPSPLLAPTSAPSFTTAPPN